MSQTDPLRVLVPSLLKSQMTRRTMLAGTAMTGMAALLAACAGPGSGGGANGALNIYTWGDYDDPAVLSDFTAANGAKITIDSYSSNPEMVAKLTAAQGTSGYDICVPTQASIEQMVRAGLLAELDHSKLPNLRNLTANVQNEDLNPGNSHSVCKTWGSTGYVYDTTVITRELTSWADFFDAAQNEASGSFSLVEDQGEIGYAYFFANGIDPHTTNPEHIAAYRDYIVGTIAPHVQAFQSYINQIITSNGRTLMHAWNGDARLGLVNSSEPDRYKWVWPSEGANLWQDQWAIVKGSPNIDAAHAFINYVLDPEISLREMEYIGYNTGVEGMKEAAEAAGVERTDLIFIEDDVLAKLVPRRTTDADQEIITIYDELKAAAGQ